MRLSQGAQSSDSSFSTKFLDVAAAGSRSYFDVSVFLVLRHSKF